MKNTSQKKKWITTAIVSIALIMVYFFVPFEGLEVQGKGCMLLFIWAVAMWIIKPMPEYLSCIITAFLMVVLFGISEAEPLNYFGKPAWFMIVFALMLSAVVQHIGLGRRIAFWMVAKYCNTFKKTIFLTNYLNAVLSFGMASGTGRAACMSTIIDNVCDSLGYKAGEYKGDHALVLSQVMTASSLGGWLYTGSGAPIMGMALVTAACGATISWLGWWKVTFFAYTLMILLTPAICWWMFKPADGNRTVDNTFAKKELEAMGPMSRAEKNCLIILVFTILLWMTDTVHGISANYVMFLSIFAMLCPGIGCTTFNEIKGKIAWAPALYLGFAMSFGTIVDSTGGFQWLANQLFLEGEFFYTLTFNQFMLIWIPFTMVIHIIFAGKNAMTTIFVPISIVLAQALGFDVYVTGLITTVVVCCGSGYLPFNSAPNLLYYGTGRFTVAQELRCTNVINIVMTLLLYISLFVYWPLIGVI